MGEKFNQDQSEIDSVNYILWSESEDSSITLTEDFSNSGQEKSGSHTRLRGRPKNWEDREVLDQFRKARKANIRLAIIRGLLNFFQFFNEVQMRSFSPAFSHCPRSGVLFDAFSDYYYDNKPEIDQLIPLFIPVRSCAADFLQRFFAYPLLSRALSLYIDVLFDDLSPEKMSLRLRCRCCDGMHEDSCWEKWDKMKMFVVKRLFEETKKPVK